MRWTTVKENCQELLQFMRDGLEEKLDFETKLQTVGCKKRWSLESGSESLCAS